MGLKMFRGKWKLLRKDRRGLSPVISTVIMTAAIIVLVLVAMSYGQSYLTLSIAQNEFNTNEQFMQTTGLQIDNVAWMIGRAQTIQYSSTYGSLQVLPDALTYTVQMFNGATLVNTATLQTGIILYNVPTTEYSLGKNYLHPIGSSNSSFLQSGSAAPDSYAYAIEKLPMSDGNFLRIVVVPTIRMMTTTVGNEKYTEFYMPILTNGTSPGLSQSVTLICKNVNQYLQSGITQITITASFPMDSKGFDSAFFPFQTTTQTLALDSTVQLYVGEVSVSLGLYP
jgi:flagellin-like protein